MRKSSRGNPWHDSIGRFCSGPSEGGCRSERTAEEYEERTAERIEERNKYDERLKEAYVEATRSGEYEEYEKVSDEYVKKYGYDAYSEANHKAIDASLEDEQSQKALSEENRMVTSVEYTSEKLTEETDENGYKIIKGSESAQVVTPDGKTHSFDSIEDAREFCENDPIETYDISEYGEDDAGNKTYGGYEAYELCTEMGLVDTVENEPWADWSSYDDEEEEDYYDERSPGGAFPEAEIVFNGDGSGEVFVTYQGHSYSEEFDSLDGEQLKKICEKSHKRKEMEGRLIGLATQHKKLNESEDDVDYSKESAQLIDKWHELKPEAAKLGITEVDMNDIWISA